MRILSIVSYSVAAGIFLFDLLLLVIQTWAGIWGIGGVMFSILLMPIATIAFPVVLLLTGQEDGLGVFLSYWVMGMVLGFCALGRWLSHKAEAS